MTVETKLAVTAQDVRSFSEANNEPSWLTELRERALADVETLPMVKPDKTNVEKWNFTEFPAHTVESSTYASLEEFPEEVKAIVDAEGQHNIYIQHNNTPAYLQLSKELASKGVILTDILTAAREHSDLVQKYFMTEGVKIDQHKLTALHAALVNGGVFVYIPKNVIVEEPIQAVFLHDNEEPCISCCRSQ